MFKTCREKIVTQNALTNAFIDYYLQQHLDVPSSSLFVGRDDVRRVIVHMKLTGKDFLSELIAFTQIIEDADDYYDFGLDHYDEDFIFDYCKFLEK